MIYLDHAATTPVRDEVLDEMAPYHAEVFGNPSSTHAPGRSASAALEEARERVAGALGASPDEIRIRRGGTESDNLAVLGRADAVRGEDGDAPLAVASTVEHRAVLDATGAVEAAGGEAVRVAVDPRGRIDDEALDRALERGPAVVSVMWVNNEVGLRLPVEEVARRCREAGVTFHTDAVQAVGKVPVRVDRVPVDLLTITGHKIYGPKSTGILFVRKGTRLRPRLFGGGQERGLRPGTQDVAGAVGMARAVELAVEEQASEADRLRALRDDLEARLGAELPGLRVHCGEGRRAPHVSNVGIPDVDLESLLMGMDLAGVAVSAGSACASGARRNSHVLEALYGAGAEEFAPLRFSLGRATGPAEIDAAVEATVRTVDRIRDAAGSGT